MGCVVCFLEKVGRFVVVGLDLDFGRVLGGVGEESFIVFSC